MKYKYARDELISPTFEGLLDLQTTNGHMESKSFASQGVSVYVLWIN